MVEYEGRDTKAKLCDLCHYDCDKNSKLLSGYYGTDIYGSNHALQQSIYNIAFVSVGYILFKAGKESRYEKMFMILKFSPKVIKIYHPDKYQDASDGNTSLGSSKHDIDIEVQNYNFSCCI